MSELIPDYNPAQNSAPHLNNIQTVKGVDLAPVVISPSRLWWRIEIVIYSAMLCSASIAIFPFLLTQFYWSLLWLLFLLLTMLMMRSAWKTTKNSPITLSVTQKIWRINSVAGEVIVQPYDDILVWPTVIILPVREIVSGRKQRIIALTDSMTSEDWRKLRVWLRMGFRE